MIADYSLFPILSKLQGLTWKSDNSNLGECYCPAHDDGEKKNKKSLHVTVKTDQFGQPKLLFHCHAGCDTASILRALGGLFSDLFPDRSLRSAIPHGNPPAPTAGKVVVPGTPSAQNPAPKLVKVYDYFDEFGKLLHQTLRYEPKEFRQRGRADANKVYLVGKKEYKSFKDPHGNWWINTIKHLEPVLYRLPEILQTDLKKWVFVCEGEKDADTLRTTFGVCATTVPMGAGKWRKSFSDTLAGRRVAIIPDMDKPRIGQTDPLANPGMDGAKKIATHLVGIAADVRILNLSNSSNLVPKWDVTDWVKAGGTMRMLAEAIIMAPPLTADHPDLLPAGMSAAEFEASMQGEPGPGDPAEGISVPDSSVSAGESEESGSSLIPAADSSTSSSLPANVKLEFGQPVRGQLMNGIGSGNEMEPLSIRAIKHHWMRVMNQWPKRVGSTLFYVDRESPEAQLDPNFFSIHYLNSASSLFGWAGDYSGSPVAFARANGYVTKEEYFHELQRTADCYESVEQYPHEPRVPSIYYACKDQDQWVSTRPGCLYELLGRFSPDEPIDQELILAFMMTLVWGGPGGARPMFVITADSGQGSGKTTLVSILTQLVGGTMSVASNADNDVIKQRLLSPEGRLKRVMLLDNCKSRHFSWAEFEAMITSERISGKEMWVGESSRVNRITYCVTVNGPSMSADMAERSVVIKLGKPHHDPNWFADTMNFIVKYRISIIAELMELLRQPPGMIETYSRWGHWEREVLCRVPNAELAQRVIKIRQGDMNADKNEGEEVIDEFARYLTQYGYVPDKHRVMIPSQVAAKWLSKALNEHLSAKQSTGRIKSDVILSARLKYTKMEKLRGFIWSGPNCRPGETPYLDLPDRIAESMPIL